jgi:2-polyprenyl-6-hydroxyphenyl methylase/3-demethylubiquinone-9 3-methyltransferase
MDKSAAEAVSFSFGKNWAQFVAEHFSDERVRIAREHLTGFLDTSSLAGKSFVDAGCGSGLHSLAAFDAGVAKLVSFDLDPFSVETTARLRKLRGDPANWTVLRGSVLDTAFLGTLEPADIVYSWGVLHHTGHMWQAIENTSALLKPEALFYIALYVTTPLSGYWLAVKKRYNAASPARKRLMEAGYAIRREILPRLIRGHNPVKEIWTYRQKRGMDYLTDVRDWLGGYPYEDASIPEVMSFCRKKLGLELINLGPSPTLAEYLFSNARAGRPSVSHAAVPGST